ncbi:MAG: hypothetical protein IJH34_06945, partial [Romboutsia sp.]|nr:hypothetical protein [Romboutsia sp.]
MLSSNSSIATPFFKQLIVEESSDDFLLEQDRCLLFFKHLEGRTLEARDFRKLKINLFLKEYREIDNYYPCMLIKENFSWISKDDNGEY